MFFGFYLYIIVKCPPKKIKIVDVVDKEVKIDDEYAVTVDELEKRELPAENEPLETAEETITIVEEKVEGTPGEVRTDSIAAESTQQIRNQTFIKCEKCGKFVTAKNIKIYK